ncbi:hypothetical protein H6B33_12235, partial [Gemmiger formicilis]|nr:hypothetical protein [Gemmiger formicilis]
MSYNDFLAGYQAWKEEEDRKTRSQSDKRAELPTAGSSAAKGETKKTGLPIAGNKNPYATYTRPSVSSPGLGTMLAPATVPQKTVDTLTPKTQQAQNDAQYNNWLLDLFGRYGTEAGESLAKGADAASRLVQKDASLGERAEAGFDLVKTGLEAGLKGATGGVTNLLDALAGREDTKEAAAAQLAADTTVDDYLGKKLTDVQRQAAIDLLNRYKAENPDIWKADPTTLPEAQEAELAKYRQLDKQLGWMAQTADRLDKGARAIWNNLAATPDVLLETGKAAALNLADNVHNSDWLEALGDAWAGAGYDDVQAMTDEEVRQDAARRAEVAQQLQETGADRTMDLDTEGAQRMQRAAELQQQAKQGLSGGAALGYDVSMAVADNLVTLPLAAIPGVGGGLVLGVQGAKAAAQEANDLAQRGISADEALLRGAVSGGIEAATEKIGLDNIMDIVGKGGKAALNSLFKDGLQQLAKKGGSSAVGRAVAGVLSNMSAEALEETASYVANYAAAEAFGDPEAEFSIEELAYSALIGGLSGGVLGGGANVLNAITGRGKTAGAQVDQQQSIPGAAPAEAGVPTTTPQGVNGTGVDLTQLYPGAVQGAASEPSTAPQSVAGTGVDLAQLYPEAQQPDAEQRNQGEAGSGFDIRQLYPDREQPSAPASPSVLANDQVDALLPSEQRASLEQFAGSKGLRVQYINDPDSLVSGSIQGNTMTINLGNGSYALGTAIHEVGHAMKAGDGKAFAEFQDAVLRLADTDPGLRRVAAGIVDAYLGDTSPARASMLNEDGSINRAALNEEVALKLAEELVQDPEQLIRTVSQDRTLIARFLDFVRKIKNSVSIRFTGSQKAMLDEAERTLENMLRGQAGEVTAGRFSVDSANDDIINELSRITAEQRALREERNAWMDSAEVQELEERRKAAIKEYGVLRLQQWKNATPEWQAYTAKRQEYNARAKALQDRADELTEALRGSRQVQEQADWEERQAQQAAYDRAVAESGLSVADYHRQSAASRFGTTDQFEAAGYILPDGQMLDFSGPEKTRRSQDHREIESVFGPAELGRNADSTTALNQFIAEGNVRVMAESPGVDISGEVRPSAAQLDAIRRMADTLGAARQGFNLDISDNTGKVVASKWYTGHVRGERVINDIRAFYETGSLPQDSGLSGFHSLRTKGGANLNGARTLDEYIAQKYGSQPAAPTATEAEAPVSDASPAAEPAASSDTEDAAPALERTAKSQSIQRRQESQFVRELGDLFGIPEGESRARLRQLTTQLADQRRTTGRIDPALADSIFEEAYQ